MDDEAFRQKQVDATTRPLPSAPSDLPTLRAAYSDRTATLMAFFAAFAYVDPPSEAGGRAPVTSDLEALGFTDLAYFRSPLKDGLALLTTGPLLSVIAFRGTRSPKNWSTNFDLWPRRVLHAAAGKSLRVHEGFYAAYEALAGHGGLRAAVQQLRQTTAGERPIYVTGHSLGGALAQIAAAQLGADDMAACYTFGSPRVGNLYLDRWVKPPSYRVVNHADIVAQIPPALFYRHAGDARYLPAAGALTPFRFEPNPLVRLWQILQGIALFMAAGHLLGVEDHSMDRYRAKLDSIVQVRRQQRHVRSKSLAVNT